MLGAISIFWFELGLIEEVNCLFGGLTILKEEVDGKGKNVLKDDVIADEKCDDRHPQRYLLHLPTDFHTVFHIGL